MKRKKLQELRKYKKITQKQMSEMLQISIESYKSIEYGYRNPGFEVMKKFKKIFPNNSIDRIFFN